MDFELASFHHDLDGVVVEVAMVTKQYRATGWGMMGGLVGYLSSSYP
jgi:hypothetical protein